TVLREAGPDRELRAEEVKRALVERGVPANRLQLWRRVQERLVAHERVAVGGDRYHRTYRWVPEPPPPTPDQALALLAEHRLPAQRRVELVEVLRAALAGQTDTASGPPGDARPTVDPVLVARLEQRERDAVRALAELAIEVEELVTNEAS